MSKTAYFSLVLIPLLGIALSYFYYSKTLGLGLFLIYILIYRPILDFNRLKSKNILVGNSFLQFYLPLFRLKYFKELYLD
jgi:hypothetical protein